MTQNTTATSPQSEPAAIRIGWAEIDMTPPKQPVYLVGQHYVRISEGVLSPLKASVCVLDNGTDYVIWICCDLVSISQQISKHTRDQLSELLPEIDPHKVILHVTHTHAAPNMRSSHPMFGQAIGGLRDGNKNSSDEQKWHVIPQFPDSPIPPEIVKLFEFNLGMDGIEYAAWLGKQLALAVKQAWDSRSAGGYAFGFDSAVVGRNRRWVNDKGNATMYGLGTPEAKESFRHIEGYEDHSLNLLATYDSKGKLTGLIVNIPSTSQELEHSYLISADFWHETRAELRKRFGEHLFILPQCSAAGDITSRLIFEREAHQRMLDLRGHSQSQEIANRISDAVGRILPAIQGTVANSAVIVHHLGTIEIPANKLTNEQYEDNLQSARKFLEEFKEAANKLLEDPELKKAPRWYAGVSRPWLKMAWHLRVAERYENQLESPTLPVEVHVIRLGDIAFATNPFEYYLDFGIQIKVRSPFIQTFLVQLAGNGSYVPSPRSVQGGGYGSVPASNIVGPEGGQVLADYTVTTLRQLFPPKED